MNVSELAEELGVAPSTVLEQCKRAGIEASWAGAELSGSDVIVLRAELASADAPLDLTGDDEEQERPADAPPVDPPGALPPTSAASIPEHAWDDASAAGDGSEAQAAEPAAGRVPGPGMGAPVAAGAATVQTKPPEERRTTPRRLDKAVRGGLVALVVAVVALLAGEVVDNAWAIWALWLVALFALLVALWNGNAGRRHVTTHPERLKGLGLAVGTMVLAIGLGIGLVASAAAAVGDDPAADAPLGDRDSVATARWGYQRLLRIQDEGWMRPAKEAGTCWRVDEDIERDVDRVEVGTDQVDCADRHEVQIIRVYAYDRDADSAYPGLDALAEDARDRCADEAEELLAGDGDEPVSGVLFAEVPTEDGWADADHDVACAIVTDPRKGELD